MTDSTSGRSAAGFRSPRDLPDRALLLLPTLNEEAGLARTLDEVDQAGRFPSGARPSILVIDGRSTDGTVTVAERHGVPVLEQLGRGKGGAVLEGLDWGVAHGFDRIAVMDADGTYPARRLPSVFTLLDHGADVVVGVRRRAGGGPESVRDAIHRAGNGFLNLTAAFLGRGPILDVCSGFWGVRAETLPGLALSSTGFEIESELVVKSFRRGHRVVQIPIEYRPRIGEAKLHAGRDGARILLSIARHGLATRPDPGVAVPPAGAGTPNPSDGTDRLNDLRTVLATLDPDWIRVVSAPARRGEASAIARSLEGEWGGVRLLVTPHPAAAVGGVDVELPELPGADDPPPLVVTDPRRRQIVQLGPAPTRTTTRTEDAIRRALPLSVGAAWSFAVLGASLDASGRRRARTLLGANLPTGAGMVTAPSRPPRRPAFPTPLPRWITVPPGDALQGRW